MKAKSEVPTIESLEKDGAALLEIHTQVTKLNRTIDRFYPGFKLEFVSITPASKDHDGADRITFGVKKDNPFLALSGQNQIASVIKERGGKATVWEIMNDLSNKSSRLKKPTVYSYLSRQNDLFRKTTIRGEWELVPPKGENA